MCICLGVGILLEDMGIILDRSNVNKEELPEYLAASPWATSEFEKLQSYIGRLHGDLLEHVASPRYVARTVGRD